MPAKETVKNKSKSQRAGIVFPAGRIQRKLKQGNYADRIGVGASVYLGAVLEYLTAEVVELAGNAARDNHKQRIMPRHVLLAVKNDEELAELWKDCTIAQGGVVPHIEKVLLPKASQKPSSADKENRALNQLQSQEN